MTTAIRIAGLVKSFGRVRVLDERGGLDTGRRDVLMERFELDPRRKCRTYSKGNRQKVALIAALSSDAELLILDEPTSGLDPLMEAVFRDCIAEEHRRGRTVLLSSHILSEVEALCDRVSIIRKGRVAESGTLAELRQLARTTVDAELIRPPRGIDCIAGVHDVRIDDLRLRCSVDDAALDDVLRVLAGAGVRGLICAPPTLEELFLRYYEADPIGGPPRPVTAGLGAGRSR